MLEEIHVRDLALIEDAWLSFGAGMTVLTGETGAGKTALLGALKLLLGERADSGIVRAQSAETVVEGRFNTPDGEIIAQRRLSSEGRSRCVLDGELATVGALSERIGPLVDLHGQHEHQALLSALTHVGYLDRWAGASTLSLLADYREARASWREASSRRDALTERAMQAAANGDYLTFVVTEIDRVDPRSGEDEELEARLPALQHAERLAEACALAADALRGEGGSIDRLADARAALTRVEGIDEALDALAARLAEIEVIADDVGSSAREYRDHIEHDPAVLDQTLQRLATLGGLKKKYGPSLDDVLSTRDAARDTLAAEQDSDEALEAATRAVEEAEKTLRRAAGSLSQARRHAAPGFSEALGVASADLAMQGARFEVGFSDMAFENWGPDGSERVEFLYAPAPGQPARPLTRIASGGEISRVMLALKSVLSAADTVDTLVFDEVDAGIGGATAQAVGARLAQLAKDHQVIVVTHLAQVAVHARAHLVVRKSVEDGSAATTVREVTGDERVAEIARMLSGNDSAASRTHALELLSSVADD